MTDRFRLPSAVLAVAWLASTALRAAEPSVPQPAEAMRPPEDNTPKTGAIEPQDPEDRPLWRTSGTPSRLLETRVTGERFFHEEEEVGSYSQPRWTARRRFLTTRIYVIPEGVAIFEYWLEVKTPFDDPKDTRWRNLYEFEMGLGHRLQLDFYLRTEQQGPSPLKLESERVELRYAFADWGKLWGNPTLYLEWIHPDLGAQWGEIKMLFGGQIVPRWYWGANISWEHRFGDLQESEYAITGAFSWAAIDSKLSIGAEAQLELTDDRNTRWKFNGVELLVGPSLQWRPLRNAHIDFVWLIGPEWGRSAANTRFTVVAINQPTMVIGWMF